MSLVILPRNSGAGSISEAEDKLQRELDDDLTVLMIVNGQGADAEAAVEMATMRASTKAMLRRVVWIPDKSVLTTKMKKFTPQGARAVSVGLDNKVAQKLSSAKAKVRIYVERAFLKAERQEA